MVALCKNIPKSRQNGGRQLQTTGEKFNDKALM